MNVRLAKRLGQLGMILLVGVVLVSAAHGLSRRNALISFSNYRADWEDSARAPVEQLAVETVRREIAHPEQDPELTQAAMSVLKRSASWVGMAPGICSQLKGWLDVRLEHIDNVDGLKPAFDLLAMAESEDSEPYKTLIAGMAGDRMAQALSLSRRAQILLDEASAGRLDDTRAFDDVRNSWQALTSPLRGKPMNWLALEVPVVATAIRDATNAMVQYLLASLEPYLGKSSGNFGETLPDRDMLSSLEHQATAINSVNSLQQEHVRRARAVLARFAPKYHFEPMCEAACTLVLRYHRLTVAGLVIATLVGSVLITGLWFSLRRMARGPKPVDVDAETMENVEPIDLDTDAETRSRSSATITEVG